jgi:hypothetical protein
MRLTLLFLVGAVPPGVDTGELSGDLLELRAGELELASRHARPNGFQVGDELPLVRGEWESNAFPASNANSSGTDARRASTGKARVLSEPDVLSVLRRGDVVGAAWWRYTGTGDPARDAGLGLEERVRGGEESARGEGGASAGDGRPFKLGVRRDKPGGELDWGTG